MGNLTRPTLVLGYQITLTQPKTVNISSFILTTLRKITKT